MIIRIIFTLLLSTSAAKAIAEIIFDRPRTLVIDAIVTLSNVSVNKTVGSMTALVDDGEDVVNPAADFVIEGVEEVTID